MQPSSFDPEEKLWRYLDLGKFLELLISRSIHFTRSDLFDDPFEGTINQSTHQAYIQTVENGLREQSKPGVLRAYVKRKGEYIVFSEKPSDVGKALSETLFWIRGHTFVNCWHRNANESEAMWRLYCKNLSEAVVIRTTVKKLAAGIASSIEIAPITYVDYAGAEIFPDYFSAPFKTKRISFSHEHELRLIIQEPPISSLNDGLKSFDIGKTIEEKGKSVELLTNLEDVIEEVRLSPSASPWLSQMLSRLLEKIGVNIPIINSEIQILPFTAHNEHH